jgi:hypothetical protein
MLFCCAYSFSSDMFSCVYVIGLLRSCIKSLSSPFCSPSVMDLAELGGSSFSRIASCVVRFEVLGFGLPQTLISLVGALPPVR